MEREVAVRITSVVVEVEHACVRRIIVVATPFEPGIVGIREVRVYDLILYNLYQ